MLAELEAYQPELLERPRLVVGTKADVAELEFDGPVMSSVTRAGVRDVVGKLQELVNYARSSIPVNDSFVILRPAPEGIRVERVAEGEFRVSGRDAERVVAISDVTSSDALAFIDSRLQRLGVGKALIRSGAREGDIVWIAGFSFEYHPDEI